MQARRAGRAVNAQPLLVIGDVSALRVRAELDERDLGDVKVGSGAHPL